MSDTTTKFKVDISDFKKKINEVDSIIKKAKSTFKASSDGTKEWANSLEGLTAKAKEQQTIISALKTKIQEYQKQIEAIDRKQEENKKTLDDLNKEYRKAQDEFGESSEEAKKFAKEIIDLERAMEQNTAESQRLDNAIDKMTGEVNKAEKAVDKLNDEQDDYFKKAVLGSEQAGKLKDSLGKMANTINTVVIGAFTALATAIGTAVTAAANAGISFESAFAGVKKTIDETEATTYDKLKQDIIDMSKVLPATVEEISAVAELAGQLGFSADDVMAFTKTMIDLGESTNLTAEDAATSLAKFGNIVGLNKNEYDKLGSSIVDLGNNYATTEKDIVDMAGRIAASGTQIGLSTPEILALATALSSVGLESEAGGTAISAVMTKIDKAVAKDSDELKVWADLAGVSVADFKKAFEKDAMGTIQKVIGGMGDATKGGENLNLILEELGITGIRESDTMKRLSNASDILNDSVDTANIGWSENTALTEEANKRYATMESRIGMVKNKLNGLGIVVYDELQEPMSEALTVVSEKMDELEELFKTPEMQKALADLGTSLAELVVAAADFAVKAAPKLIEGLQWLLDHKTEIKDTLVGWAIAFGAIKVGGAAVGVYKFFKNISELITKFKGTALFTAISTNATKMWGVLSGVFGKIMGSAFVTKFLLPAGRFIVSKIPIIAAITAVIAVIWLLVANWDEVSAWLVEKWEALKGWAVDLWDGITLAFQNGWNAIVAFFTETIPEWYNLFIEWLENLPYQVGYWIGQILAKIYLWAVDVWAWINEDLPLIIDAIVLWFAGLPEKIWDWLVEAYNKVVLWGIDTYNVAVAYVSQMITNIIEWFSTLPSRIWQWLLTTLLKVVTWLDTMKTTAFEKMGEFAENVVNAVRNLPNAMVTKGREIVEGIIKGIREKWDWAVGIVRDFFGGIIKGAQDELDSHSPSRVFMRLGENSVEGYEIPWQKQAANVRKVVQSALDFNNMRVAVGGAGAVAQGGLSAGGRTVNFTQINNSPTALSRTEIYRQSKNAAYILGGNA